VIANYTCAIVRFCIGDRYYLCDNKILCQFDYEERLVFANLQSQGYAGSVPALSKHSTVTKVTPQSSHGLCVIQIGRAFTYFLTVI